MILALAAFGGKANFLRAIYPSLEIGRAKLDTEADRRDGQTGLVRILLSHY
jgi:hypothetical protein